MRKALSRVIRSARRLAGVFLTALKACFTHRASSKAAALAFYTLFSMAPILVLVVAVAEAFLGSRAAQGDIFAQLKLLVGPAGAQILENLEAEARVPGSGHLASGIAVVLLLFGATSVFAELKDSLDEIWKVQVPTPTGLVAVLRTRLLSFGLVLTLSFLLLASLVINGVLGILERFWGNAALGIVNGLSSGFTFLVIACLFAVIYKMLPEVDIPWRGVAVGALSTAALFTLGKYAIGAYLSNSTIGTSFGAAGSAAALLIWVYYSAQIFFLGAEFTRVYVLAFGSRPVGRGHGPEGTPEPPPPLREEPPAPPPPDR